MTTNGSSRSERDGRLETSRRLDVAGVSLGVISGEDRITTDAWGIASNRGEPMTPETLAQAASLSKAVSAFGALCLVRDGALDLDVPIHSLLRRWAMPRYNDAIPLVSVRQLLSHTAGFNVSGFAGYHRRAPLPRIEQVLAGVDPANSPPIRSLFASGGEARYSGGGYCVLQLLMEDVTNEKFPSLMRRLVLAPLGMRSSTFECPLPDAYKDRTARGHRADGVEADGGWSNYPELAAAGLWTTTGDLARFVLGVIHCFAEQRGALLSPDLADEFVRPQPGGRGLGGIVGRGSQGRWLRHAGQNFGFVAKLFIEADQGAGAVLMCNSERGLALLE